MTDTKKRSLLLAITVALVSLAMAVLLAGCGSSDTKEDTTADTTDTAVETTEDSTSALDTVTNTDSTDATADTNADANANTEETTPAADMTLEEWFDANPSEFQTMQDSFQQGFTSGLGDSDISAEATLEAEGNELVCKVTIGMEMTDDQIAAASEAMQPELVDYESSIKDLLSEFYDTTLVKSGEAAFKFLDRRIPDLILLDYLMPGMDGPEFLKM
ncbi:MAG: hypothetical protein J5804_00630, partial [Eggerthellaceae bacterium]|nr:hypothetical protein [Eggerthellaceae bacterium]